MGETRYTKVDLLYVKIFWDAPKLKGEKVMDFIRKNWSRLSLAFLSFIGGVIAVVAWINNASRFTSGDWINKFFNIALLISTILFFFGMAAITVMKSVQNSKKFVSMLYMCVGGIITVLYLVFIVIASINQADLILIFGNGSIVALYLVWVPFLVFGLHPLIKGITRFIEAETVPAQATVKPVAAPVKEAAPVKAPAAKAPVAKAPAKKAAPKAPAAK